MIISLSKYLVHKISGPVHQCNLFPIGSPSGSARSPGLSKSRQKFLTANSACCAISSID